MTRAGWLWPTMAALVTGCATNGRFAGSHAVQPARSAVELSETPFFPQTEDLCGPAALATLLNHAGVEVSFEELRPAIYIPERRGSLQLELVAAIRRFERVPYRIEPSLSSLLEELHAGRPVLVLQNLGVKVAPLWHYAVAVGYDPAKKQLILRSGDTRRHLIGETRFIRSWRRGDYWGLVALRPDELPAAADPERYLRTVAAIESIGLYDVALQAYRTALERWPESSLALLGVGNVSYARGDLLNAERAYRRLIAAHPGHVIALNNLAQTLADQGCGEEAESVIQAAHDVPNLPDRFLSSLAATRDTIRSTAARQRACSN